MEHNPNLCQCPLAGYCERYKKNMLGRLWELCNSNSDLGQHYRGKWSAEAAGKEHLPPEARAKEVQAKPATFQPRPTEPRRPCCQKVRIIRD